MAIPQANIKRAANKSGGAIGSASRWCAEPLSVQDVAEATRLFHETIHTVNARDYSEEQLEAWAPGDASSLAAIEKRLKTQLVLGVKDGGSLAGFGSLDDDGDIDMLFVEKDHQRQGIAQCIVKEIERLAAARGKTIIGTFASIPARPFFERMGYATRFENTVIRNGVELINYRMEKKLPPHTEFEAKR